MLGTWRGRQGRKGDSGAGTAHAKSHIPAGLGAGREWWEYPEAGEEGSGRRVPWGTDCARSSCLGVRCAPVSFQEEDMGHATAQTTGGVDDSYIWKPVLDAGPGERWAGDETDSVTWEEMRTRNDHARVKKRIKMGEA